MLSCLLLFYGSMYYSENVLKVLFIIVYFVGVIIYHVLVYICVTCMYKNKTVNYLKMKLLSMLIDLGI